jgi:hypothetical protein
MVARQLNINSISAQIRYKRSVRGVFHHPVKESFHPKTHDNYKDVVSFGLKRAKEFLEELGDHTFARSCAERNFPIFRSALGPGAAPLAPDWRSPIKLPSARVFIGEVLDPFGARPLNCLWLGNRICLIAAH